MFSLFVGGNAEKPTDSLILTPEATTTPLNKNAFYTILIKVLLGELKPRPDCWVTFEDQALNLPINEFWLKIFDSSPQKTAPAKFIIAELLKENQNEEIKSILNFCLGYLIAKKLYEITDDEFLKLKTARPDITMPRKEECQAEFYFFLEDYTSQPKPLFFFKAAAISGNAFAINELGNLICNAEYVPTAEDFKKLGIKDPSGNAVIHLRNKRAGAFYLKAGELGCADADNNLGNLLKKSRLIIGEDLHLVNEKGLNQYQAAALSYRAALLTAPGHAAAAESLSDLIFEGNYKPRPEDFHLFQIKESGNFFDSSAPFYRVAGQLGCGRFTYALAGLIFRGYSPTKEDFTAFKIEPPQYKHTKQDDIDLESGISKRYGFGKRIIEENIFCFIAALQGHKVAFDHFKKAYPLIRKLYDYKPLFKACIIPLLIRYRTFPEYLLEFLRDEKIRNDMVEVILENKAELIKDKMALVDNNRAMGQVINYHRWSGTLKESNETASSERIIQEFGIPFIPKPSFWATLIPGTKSEAPPESTLQHLYEHNL